MRKITANYIFPVVGKPLKNGIIVLNENNQIVDLIDRKGEVKEIQNLEFYGGMIVPGFVDIFSLVSWAKFTKGDFKNLLQNNGLKDLFQLLSEKKKDKQTEQRAINHFEAFGTKAVADFWGSEESLIKKNRSKTSFYNFDSIPFDLPKSESKSPVLLNEFTFDFFDTIDDFDSDQICIGTGSLGMFEKLSVFEQMKKVQNHFQNVSLFEIIKFGSLNTALQIGVADQFGSLEKGKTPGLNIISNFDVENWKLKPESELKVLI